MKRIALMLGLIVGSSSLVAGVAIAGQKGMGVSCKSSSECAGGMYCKANKAHLPGYFGTCQRR